MTGTTSALLNTVDYFVLFVIGLSMLAGYIRGFMKEIVSLTTFVAATILSSMFSGKLAAMFSGAATSSVQSIASSVSSVADVGSSMSMLSIAVSFVAIFMATLFIGYIVGTLVTGIAGAAATETLTNRFLGALFGGVRGAVLVVVLMFIAELSPMADQPAWKQSQFVATFQPIVSWVSKMVDPGIQAIRQKAESTMQNLGGQMPSMPGAISNLLNQGGGQ